MKKKNIGVLITIIILLIIFVPSAIYGTYMHFKLESLGGNPNKEFYYEGKLYFYNKDSLLGTYTCSNKECGYEKNYIDENHDFESFNNESSEIKMINNSFAFLKDGENVFLYDVKKEEKLAEYKAVKNYSVGISNNCFIVKNTMDKWGMLCISNTIKVTIPFNYNYLGLINFLNSDGLIDNSKIVANIDQEWRIISDQNSNIVTVPNQIYSYSDNFVLTKENSNIQIFDYNNNAILNNYRFVDVKILENIIVATTNNGFYVIYNTNTKKILKTMPITNNGEYYFEIIDNTLKISQGNQVIDTIALT